MLRIYPGLDKTQNEIYLPRHNYTCIDWKACRRAGKSHLAKAIIIKYCVGKGQRILYLTPSASQFEAMYNFFAHESPPIRSRQRNYGCKLQPTPHLTYVSGGYNEYRSLEVLANARGGEWDIVIVDESQDLKCNMDEFDAVVQPMLANRNGRLYFFGQFAGKNEQFRRYYVPGVPPGELYHDPALYNPKKYLSIRTPWNKSLFFQTAQGQEWLNERRKTMPSSVFKQEFDCICLDSGSGVFERVDNIIGGESHKAPHTGEVYYIFWDAGKEGDPSAIVVFAKYAGIVCNTLSLELGMPYTEQVQWVKRQGQYYGPNVCYGVDTTSGGTNSNAIEDFCRPILPGLHGLNFNQYAKEDFVRRAQIEMESRTCLIPKEHEELIGQLRRYTYDRHPITGRYSYHAPTGEHDDFVSAFIGCLHMRSQNWGPMLNGVRRNAVMG